MQFVTVKRKIIYLYTYLENKRCAHTYIFTYKVRDGLWKHWGYRIRWLDLGSREWETRTREPGGYAVGLSEDVQLTVCASVRRRCEAARWPLYKSLVAAGAMADTRDVQVKLRLPVPRQQKSPQLTEIFFPFQGMHLVCSPLCPPMQWTDVGRWPVPSDCLPAPWGTPGEVQERGSGQGAVPPCRVCWVTHGVLGSEWAEGVLQKLGRGKLWAGIMGRGTVF